MVYVMDDELYHHGIKGQKWGVRRYQNEDGSLTAAGKVRLASGNVPLSTRLAAKKDAKEYARAKMYYGEGAGTRRKLINATVNQRSKNDPFYKEEFDRQLSKQDMAKHAAKARAERTATDTKNAVVKTGKGIINAARGIGYVSATAATIYSVAHYTGLDKKVMEYGERMISNIPNSVSNLGYKWADYRFNKSI